MSRSKHTRPRQILAATRLLAPHESRGHDDPSSQHRIARALKELGMVTEITAPNARGAALLPRVSVTRPRKGYGHPAGKADIERVLRFFGEQCYYGLRAIELLQGEPVPANGPLLLGSLSVPGRILIYDQPPSPWRVPGTLPERQQERLRRAGALVEWSDNDLKTKVLWPEETLKDFVLFDVLMHEVGHHIIQQYKGKRGVRVMRTKDHEAFADHFAYRCRRAYHQSRESQI